MTKPKKSRYLALSLWQYLTTPKSIFLLLAAAAMNMTYLSRFRDILMDGKTISILTPFLLLLCSPQIFPSPHFFMSAFVFFLLSQYPRTDGGFMYQMIRTRRTRWILSEILQIICVSLIAMLALFLASILVMIPHVSLSLSWDQELPVWQELLIGSWKGTIPYAVIGQLSQPQAFAYALGLWWLYCIFGGLFLLVIRLFVPRQRNIGLGMLFCLYFFDYICEYCLPYAARYASPVALSRISYLDWGFDPIYPSASYAVAFLLMGCFALCTLSILLAKRTDLDALSARTYK
ncbi:MAG: hypothetical protein RR824_06825 [Clostridia bacterium]